MGRLENWQGVIDKPILGLLTFGSNLDFIDFGSNLIHFVGGATTAHPLQPISRPCSIEIMYPREWQIAIPASLFRVENATFSHFFQIVSGLVPGFVSWVLGLVFWVLGFVFWVLGIVCWVLGFVFWCLDLSFGCLELSVGCLGLSFGCLDLSFG